MQHYLNRSVCLLLLCLPCLIVAQNNTEAAVTAYQKGEAAMLARDYRQAARHFDRAAKLQPTLLLAYHSAGTAYELNEESCKSAAAFSELTHRDSLFSRVAYYKAGLNFYKCNQPDSALYYFMRYRELQKKQVVEFGLPAEKEARMEPELLTGLSSRIRAVQVAMDSVKFINLTEVINLGKGVNSPADDYFPFLTNNREWLYFTRQRNNSEDEDLYLSKRKNRTWGQGERVKDFNTEFPEGMTTLVRDGRRIFFTACRRDSAKSDCDIWLALAEGNKIVDAEGLGAPLNSPYWESQAAISCDGRTIIFASNRPGGFGGSDLYQSERTPDGRWGEPKNLGAHVNTEKDEEGPFISNDGQTLFFSSDGHPGLGEQDIFMCWWNMGTKSWNQPINIGPPVNSAHRELGMHLTADGRIGYFASNRPGGEGGMDIYSFELSEHLFGEPISYVQGYVMDSVLRTGIATTVDINGRPTIETYPDGRFFLCVGADEVLDARVTVPDYKKYHNQFVIPSWDNREHYDIELLLRPEVSFLGGLLEETFSDSTLFSKPKRPVRTVTHTVYFGFDEDELNANTMNDLADFVTRSENLKIQRIIIAGFADSTGSDVYNLRLSEKRAKNVAIFMVQHGLMVDQIHIEGMGANQQQTAKGDKARRVEIRLEVE